MRYRNDRRNWKVLLPARSTSDARIPTDAPINLGVTDTKLRKLLGDETTERLTRFEMIPILRPFFHKGYLDDEYLRSELHPLIHLTEPITLPAWLQTENKLVSIQLVQPLLLICVGDNGALIMVTRRPLGLDLLENKASLMNVHKAAQYYYEHYLEQRDFNGGLLETIQAYL